MGWSSCKKEKSKILVDHYFTYTLFLSASITVTKNFFLLRILYVFYFNINVQFYSAFNAMFLQTFELIMIALSFEIEKLEIETELKILSLFLKSKDWCTYLIKIWKHSKKFIVTPNEFHKNKMVLIIMDWQKFSRYILNTILSHFLFLIHYLVMIADKKLMKCLTICENKLSKWLSM